MVVIETYFVRCCVAMVELDFFERKFMAIFSTASLCSPVEYVTQFVIDFEDSNGESRIRFVENMKRQKIFFHHESRAGKHAKNVSLEWKQHHEDLESSSFHCIISGLVD